MRGAGVTMNNIVICEGAEAVAKTPHFRAPPPHYLSIAFIRNI